MRARARDSEVGYIPRTKEFVSDYFGSSYKKFQEVIIRDAYTERSISTENFVDSTKMDFSQCRRRDFRVSRSIAKSTRNFLLFLAHGVKDYFPSVELSCVEQRSSV